MVKQFDDCFGFVLILLIFLVRSHNLREFNETDKMFSIFREIFIKKFLKYTARILL